MDNNKEYISILIESLKKKKHILRDIRVADEEQKDIAMNEPFDDEAFGRNIEEKEALIKALISLDRGFDSVYSRVSETLKNNKEAYKEEIMELKELVSEVTGLSMDIQAEEARNKELLLNCFSGLRRKISANKTSNQVASSYYQTMANLNYVEPQFMDKKK